ncbi:unnamed protein product, partial [Nesidiocoris tenuis]
MFDVIITGPGSSAVPVRCYQQKDGNLLAEFMPSMIVLRKGAGFAELDVTVRSPVGQDLPLAMKTINQDTDLIELCPPLPGKYAFNITYGGQKITDSPVTFNVIEGGAARAWGAGLSRALVGAVAHFNVSCVGLCPPDRPMVQISGPPGVPHVNASIVPKKQDQYEVSYTPVRVGMYDVTITCSGKHISGEITGECSGPQGSTVPVNIQQDMPESAQVILTPKAPGPHTLSLFYAGFPLTFSPINALAEASNGGVRLILTGKGLASAICNQVAEFNIDGSQAGPGIPEVTLTGMKNEIKVNLQHIGDNVYKATYTPVSAGAYLLNVMWSD